MAVGPSRPHHGLLLALVLLLAGTAVAGGLLVQREHSERARARESQERYGEVLRAARAQAEAFINIRHDAAEESIDRVIDGATGEFRSQYATSRSDVIEVLRRNRSVMEGEVVWAGVVDVDPERATVVAATSGSVANTETDGEAVARDYRLELELSRVDGRWLTSDLRFVE